MHISIAHSKIDNNITKLVITFTFSHKVSRTSTIWFFRNQLSELFRRNM